MRDPKPHLYGRRPTVVEKIRFLGLIPEYRLTWLRHLQDLKVTCTKMLPFLCVLSLISCCADLTVLFWLIQLHRSLILSNLAYGSSSYSLAPPAVSGFSLLSTMQESGWQRTPCGCVPLSASLYFLLTFADRSHFPVFGIGHSVSQAV